MWAASGTFRGLGHLVLNMRIFVLLLVLASCARSSAQPNPSVRPEKARPVASLPALPPPSPAPSDTPRDPRLEAKLAERDRLKDWRSSIFGTNTERVPNDVRARPISRSFPSSGVATIRAYHFLDDFRRSTGAGEVSDENQSFPYAKDGSLDARIVPPETTLTDAETSEVLRLMETAFRTYEDPMNPSEARRPSRSGKARRPRVRCGFDPHHVLVLFDEKDRPIGKIFVCFGCGELLATRRSRAFGGAESAVMTEEERTVFRRIFDAHGLGAWAYGDPDEPELQELREYELRVYGYGDDATPLGLERRAERDALPSGVSEAVTPKGASPAERERFCVWLRETMIERDRRMRRSVVGPFECPNGGSSYYFSTEGDRGCESAPLCDVPMGRIEACLRGSVLSGAEKMCTSGVPPECEGLMTCLPYVTWYRR